VHLIKNVSLTISLVDDVNVEAGGKLKVTAGGNAFLGSLSDVSLDQVTAGGQVRLKTKQGITNGVNASTINVTGNGIVLEAGGASVGAPTLSVTTHLTGGTLTARAQEDVYITTSAPT